ncbi:MAG TPA: 16S rRNA (cytosine(1402)-N(4))-methyltransferase RsmH [Aquificaceae bacterium]|nr:16S rRNA (cytosine(1402)-N(4))-methyltransferase RsmH [Aquificaceae bacterium]
MKVVHKSVLLKESVEILTSNEGKIYVDCTLGGGGHAKEILKRRQDIYLIGIDKDDEAIEIAKENLKGFEGRISIYKADFRNLDLVLQEEGIEKVDGFLFDLGVSIFQIKGERGFSFQINAPLDMRMDPEQTLTAYKVVNNYPERELIRILKEFGEEKFAVKIAKAIVQRRKKKPIETTEELVDIILSVVPEYYKHGRIHPATRTFQAIRIEVNRELESLKESLEKTKEFLAPKGRLVVISFHSLEDRIVKSFMKEKENQGILRILTKKPITPSPEELRENPASRSAKLRAAERL